MSCLEQLSGSGMDVLPMCARRIVSRTGYVGFRNGIQLQYTPRGPGGASRRIKKLVYVGAWDYI